MRRPILATLTAAALLTASSAALAQSSAAPLSVAAYFDTGTRAGADTEQANYIRGGFILPTLALIGIGVAVYLLTKNNKPKSP